MTDERTLLDLTTRIVTAQARRQPMSLDSLRTLILQIHAALAQLGGRAAGPLLPAVPVERSVHTDHLVCLEDGAELTLLRRHIRVKHGLSPQEYRAKWGLPPDYPMTAPRYATRRSGLAKSIGLGTVRAGRR